MKVSAYWCNIGQLFYEGLEEEGGGESGRGVWKRKRRVEEGRGGEEVFV